MNAEGGQSLYRPRRSLTEMAAEEIRANWHQWEQEAGEQAQVEQSTRAGEEYLFNKIRDKLLEFFKDHG